MPQRLFPDLADARFRVADVATTGLPAGCADAVVALDVLQLLAQPTGDADRGDPAIATPAREHGKASVTPRLASLATCPKSSSVRGCAWTAAPKAACWQRQLPIYQHATQLAAEAPGDPAICELADERRRWRAGHRGPRLRGILAEPENWKG
jgi:hypothetical protein